jgi:hypothetical protein
MRNVVSIILTRQRMPGKGMKTTMMVDQPYVGHGRVSK